MYLHLVGLGVLPRAVVKDLVGRSVVVPQVGGHGEHGVLEAHGGLHVRRARVEALVEARLVDDGDEVLLALEEAPEELLHDLERRRRLRQPQSHKLVAASAEGPEAGCRVVVIVGGGDGGGWRAAAAATAAVTREGRRFDGGGVKAVEEEIGRVGHVHLAKVKGAVVRVRGVEADTVGAGRVAGPRRVGADFPKENLHLGYLCRAGVSARDGRPWGTRWKGFRGVFLFYLIGPRAPSHSSV